MASTLLSSLSASPKGKIQALNSNISSKRKYNKELRLQVKASQHTITRTNNDIDAVLANLNSLHRYHTETSNTTKLNNKRSTISKRKSSTNATKIKILQQSVQDIQAATLIIQTKANDEEDCNRKLRHLLVKIKNGLGKKKGELSKKKARLHYLENRLLGLDNSLTSKAEMVEHKTKNIVAVLHQIKSLSRGL